MQSCMVWYAEIIKVKFPCHSRVTVYSNKCQLFYSQVVGDFQLAVVMLEARQSLVRKCVDQLAILAIALHG